MFMFRPSTCQVPSCCEPLLQAWLQRTYGLVWCTVFTLQENVEYKHQQINTKRGPVCFSRRIVAPRWMVSMMQHGLKEPEALSGGTRFCLVL